MSAFVNAMLSSDLQIVRHRRSTSADGPSIVSKEGAPSRGRLELHRPLGFQDLGQEEDQSRGLSQDRKGVMRGKLPIGLVLAKPMQLSQHRLEAFQQE